MPAHFTHAFSGVGSYYPVFYVHFFCHRNVAPHKSFPPWRKHRKNNTNSADFCARSKQTCTILKNSMQVCKFCVIKMKLYVACRNAKMYLSHDLRISNLWVFLQKPCKIYTYFSIFKKFHYNDEPTNFLSLIISDYYTYSNQGIKNTNVCSMYTYVLMYTVTTVTYVQWKR
jgi:hypothetical protein